MEMVLGGWNLITNYDEQAIELLVHDHITCNVVRYSIDRAARQAQMLGLRPKKMCLAKCGENGQQALLFPYIEERVIWVERDERLSEDMLVCTAPWLFILLDWTRRVAINNDNGSFDSGPPVQLYKQDLIKFLEFLQEGITNGSSTSGSLLLGTGNLHGKGASPWLGRDDFVTSWEYEP